MKCKHNDCGRCYCESGRSNGDCNKREDPDNCEEHKMQLEGVGGLGGILQGIKVIADDFLPSQTMVVSRDIFECLSVERDND